MIEYVKLEPGEWFIMLENYYWYKGEEHFLTFVPEPETFEEFENRLHLYYDLPEDVFFKVYYYNYYNFAILCKNCEEN